MGIGKSKVKALTLLYSAALATTLFSKTVYADGDGGDAGFITIGSDGKITFSPTDFDNSGLNSAETSSSEEIINGSRFSQSDQQMYLNIAIGIAILVLLISFIRNTVLLASGGNNKVSLEKAKTNFAYNLLSIALLGSFWACFWLFHGLFR